MEPEVITRILIIGLSILILNYSIFLMYKIYKVINSSDYRTLWWITMTLILLFHAGAFFALHGIITRATYSYDNYLGLMFFFFSLFVSIVIHTGYKTTFDLKKSTVSKKYLDSIVQTMNSFLVVTDSNCKVKLVNQSVCKTLGRTKEDLLGSNIDEIFKGLPTCCKFQSLGNKPNQAFMEAESCDLDIMVSIGSIYKNSMESDGYVFQGFVDYKKKIEDLNDYYKSILNSSDFAIIATDVEGQISGLNPAAEKYFGYTESELINKASVFNMHCTKHINQYVSENELSEETEGFNIFSHTVDKGEVILREMKMVRKNGESFPALVTINAIKNGEETVGYFEIIADISEKTKAQQELTKANEELKDFAHIVSHDLKAPLRAIGTLASWLHDDYADQLEEEGQEQFNLLRSRVSRMEGLINGILEYSRVGKIKENECELDLQDVLEDVKDSVVPMDNFKVQIDPDLPAVHMDRTRVHQIFQNIISNSVKYMDKDLGQIIIGCEREDGFYKFSVADNGPGIEKQYFDKIFQIFQTLTPRDEYESTGVGLAIVKKSVELYGGKVWLDSVVDKGTTFYFTIPEN